MLTMRDGTATRERIEQAAMALFVSQGVSETPQAFRGLPTPQVGLKVVRLQFEQQVQRVDEVGQP